MSIKIGDKNKIKNSNIGNRKLSPSQEKNFASRHPIIIGVFTSFVVGFILLFPIWNSLVEWIINFLQ